MLPMAHWISSYVGLEGYQHEKVLTRDQFHKG